MNFLEETSINENTNTNSIWAERYRPTSLSDYVGNDVLKEKVKQYINENDIPHLLLYGGAGTGKTTLAKLITKSIKCDVLYINASDDNGIDTIRVKIKNFASTIGFNGLKVIILDEADYLTAAGQAGLRNTMETYSMNTRFILTCNYHERITEPIQSRCQSYAIHPPTKKDVAANLVKILQKENVKFDKESVVLLVNSHYPDIRAIINTTQRGVINAELKLAKEDVLQGDIKSKLIDMLKNTNKKQAFTDIRQLVADNSLKNFSDLYTEMYEKVDVYAGNAQGEVILALAEGQYQEASVADREICFMATIYKVLTITK
jgi:DNA polymerase III delta prime subunit